MTARRVLLGLGIGLLGLVAAVLAFVGAALLLTEPELPQGVTLAGAPLSGLSEQAAATTVRGLADSAARATLFLDPDAGPESLRHEVAAADAGIAIDVDATLASVRALLPTAVERVRGVLARNAPDPEPVALEFVVAVDDEVRLQLARQIAGELTVEPRAATVTFDPATGQVTTSPATHGARVEATEVATALDGAAAELAGGAAGQLPVAVPAQDRPAPVDDAEARVVAGAWRAMSGATVLMLGPDAAPVSRIRGIDLAAIAQAVEDPDAAPGQRLRLELPVEAVTSLLEEPLAALAVEPQDAHIVVEPVELAPPSREQPLDTARWGGTTRVEAGAPGAAVDFAGLAQLLLQRAAAAGGSTVPWEVPVPLTPVDADLTDAEAAALGVVQPVASFTTFHACCESRVTNIHRIAEIVDGHQILPGESFELNHFVGERTTDRGFVEGGAILEGEFVTSVGGGVSQFATTFFNAAWFAGAELVTHQPHSIYISRYPAGREATINFPGVNLEIANDSPYAIVVDTSFTDTSVTVTFWSTPYWTVETITGEQRPNDFGSFTIFVARERRAADGTTGRDEFTTVYRLEQGN